MKPNKHPFFNEDDLFELRSQDCDVFDVDRIIYNAKNRLLEMKKIKMLNRMAQLAKEAEIKTKQEVDTEKLNPELPSNL